MLINNKMWEGGYNTYIVNWLYKPIKIMSREAIQFWKSKTLISDWTMIQSIWKMFSIVININYGRGGGGYAPRKL